MLTNYLIAPAPPRLTKLDTDTGAPFREGRMEHPVTSRSPAPSPAATRQFEEPPSASSWIAALPDDRLANDAFNPAGLLSTNVVRLRNLLTIEEVADYFRVSTKTIRRWVKAGKLLAVSEGRTLRFRHEDIIELTAASIRRSLEQRYRLHQHQPAQPTEAESLCK